MMHRSTLPTVMKGDSQTVDSSGAATHRCVPLLTVILLLLPLCFPAQAIADPLDTYHRAMQVMLDESIVPTLKKYMTQHERDQLQDFHIEVTNSNDPQQMWTPNPHACAVSAGFMSLQDLLIEAAIISATDPHTDQLFDYAVDVTRYSLTVNSFGTKVAPISFWARIGWQSSQYQQLRTTSTYTELRLRGTQQSLAWLASVMMYEQLLAPTTNSHAHPSMDRSRNVYENAAELMFRSDLAPAPPWPIAMLYAANTSHSRRGPVADRWMCEAKQIVDVAADVAQRPAPTLSTVEQHAQQKMVDDWRDLSAKLGMRGHCRSSNK